MSLEKVCSKCGRKLPICCFSKHKRSIDGYRTMCKECDRDLSYRRLYGISLEDARIILEKQENKCALCGKSLELPSKNAHVDHDHITGKIRGILCMNCNMALGRLGESVEKVNRVLRYLGGNAYV